MHSYQRFDLLRKAQEQQASIRTKLLFSVFVLFCFLFVFAVLNEDLFSLIPSQNAPFKPDFHVSPTSSLQRPSLKTPVSKEEKTLHTIDGCVSSGQTFCSILSDHGFAPSVSAHLVTAFKPIFDCRKIAPGNTYQMVTDAKGNLVSVIFKTSPITIYRLTRDGQDLIPSKDKIILDKRIAVISGKIENSLFGALTDAGEKDQLAMEFADIFAWDIDFRHDLRKGDRFRIILEKVYKDEQFIHYGKIQAAECVNQGKIHRAVYFRDSEGREDYYSPEGISVRRSFLRSPLRFTRISSGYSYRRFHPILKRHLPHLGIDFAAPTGTPVLAVGDGVVVRKGWKNGNGNMIVIRHPNGYETMYNHLSRFGKNIKVGKRVSQKDVIGYVGTTGLATGPHLDYRMKKNGQFINPLKEKFPSGFPVNEACRSAFLEVSQQMMALLDGKDSPSQKIVAGLK